MRPRSLRPALLAALAALLFTAGLAHTSEASDGASEGGTITTLLHPGWNMVGWVGPETPTSELFDALPQLQTVGAWDASAGAYRYEWRGLKNDVPAVTPGMGLWLYLGGDRQLYWTRPGTSDGVVLRLGAGRRLVGVVADGAVEPPEDADARAWRWDPLRQDYEPYRFGDATLRGGEALWIEAAAPFNLWQPGTESPPLFFLGDVSDYRRETLLGEYPKLRRYFAEEFGVAIRGNTHYIAADVEAIRPLYLQFVGREPPEGFCGRSVGSIQLVTVRCIGPPGGTLDYDYISQLLIEVPGKGVHGRGEPALDPRGPGWLIAGARQYALEEYRGGPTTRQRLNLETGARRTSLPLSYFEVSDNRDGATNFSETALGFFAVEWLAQRAGNPAVFDYLKLVRTSNDWRAAFATAFGIDVEDFYLSFATYRAGDLTPLPHLIDDLDAPALVFLGDVPEADAAEVRAEFENVQQFYSDRFEARATEFTLYVAADESTALRAFPDRRHHSCSSPPSWSSAVALLEQCLNWSALERIYVGAMVQELAPLGLLRFPGISAYTESSRGPNWLLSGLENYATTAYQAAAGRRDLAYNWEAHARVARSTSYSLREVANTGDGPVAALGYLAVDWLVERAGDRAVFEYYRLLLPEPSVEAAFERAFGLTIEAFYLEFDEYHARLRESGQ
ncbi:MAG: hypothetical protein F4X25_00415 [Chloroflexi bacterium]|nr:hypothetical protein [Chloroflexota bacterium]